MATPAQNWNHAHPSLSSSILPRNKALNDMYKCQVNHSPQTIHHDLPALPTSTPNRSCSPRKAGKLGALLSPWQAPHLAGDLGQPGSSQVTLSSFKPSQTTTASSHSCLAPTLKLVHLVLNTARNWFQEARNRLPQNRRVGYTSWYNPQFNSPNTRDSSPWKFLCPF